MTSSPKRYPGHLWTLDFQLPPGLPGLFHHYPTEAEARAGYQIAVRLMNTSPGVILGLALYHRQVLQSSARPTPLPVPKPLPPPSPDGVTRLPAHGRRLSSQYFRSADLVVLDPSEVRI